jgi:hypothetical protein
MSTDNPENAASVNIGTISYRARCTEAGCKNLGCMLMIYADAGGRPISHPVLCHAHARVRLARDRAAGLRSTTIGGLRSSVCPVTQGPYFPRKSVQPRLQLASPNAQGRVL